MRDYCRMEQMQDSLKTDPVIYFMTQDTVNGVKAGQPQN